MNPRPDNHELLISDTKQRFVNRSDILPALDAAHAQSRAAGVVYLDIDRFHQVNSQFGQHVGDQVLEVVGGRLADITPSTALLARAEGDAFLAVVLDADAAASRAFAEQLLAALSAPILLGAITVTIEASAGVAVRLPSDASSDLVEHAFLACRRAKTHGPAGLVLYERELGTAADNRQRIEAELRHARTNHELRLYVQPTVDLRSGQVVGVEALIRWQHPVDGLLAPGSFLPVAEEAGLMVSIGDWVLDEAIALAGRWSAARDGEPMRVWVNLAAQQLAESSRLCEHVRAAVQNGRITPRSIGFEVTESSLLEDLPAAVDVLSTLRDLGFEIALDDFGTGYSSLSYLRQLPVTAVKIDRSFVARIGGSLADEAIVEAVIDLAHALGLRVIAEGIEHVGQADALIRMGADQAQGFHFARPEPEDVVAPKLSAAWCGVTPPAASRDGVDPRSDELPGFSSPRARLLLSALDTAHDSIVVTGAATGDPDGSPILYVNAAFEAETGYRAADVVGRTMSFLLPDAPDATVLQWFADTHRGALAATTEVVNRRADGSLFLCELTLSPILDERGFHTHWLHVRRDLTQRRSAEDDRARFQGLIEQSTSLVFLAETGGQFVYANAAQRRALGLGPDDPLDGLSTREVLGGHQMSHLEARVKPTLERDRQWSGEGAFTNALTGERTEVVTDVQMLTDPLRPGINIFAAVSRDVTELRRMEKAERRRRKLGGFAANLAQRALTLTSDEFFADIDATLASFGELLDVDLTYLDTIDLDNNVLQPVGGWTSPHYDGRQQPPGVVSLDELPNWIRHLQGSEVLMGVEGDPARAAWADELHATFPGQTCGTHLHAPLRVRGVLMGVLGVATVEEGHAWDADELETVQQLAEALANLLGRQRAEHALRTSESRLAAMLANVADILLVIDRDGWIRYINPRVGPATGYEPEEIIGSHFLRLVHDDDKELAVERFGETVAGIESDITELRLIHRDGTAVWYDVDTEGVDDPIVGGYTISLRNVSVQRASLESAERSAAFEQVVSGFSRWAVEVASDEVVDGLRVHLEHLGRTLGADSAFVLFLEEEDRLRNVAGWATEPGATDHYQLPSDQLPAVAARYRTLEPLIVSDIELHDEPWADEWRSFPVPDRAGLNVPLGSGGRCLGNIGVAMTHAPRVWTAEEIALVQRVSETVAAVLARHRVEASLRTSEARLAALLDGSLDLVVVVSLDGVVQYVNGAAESSLGYTPEQLVGRNVATVVHPDDLAFALGRLAGQILTGSPLTTLRLIAADGTVGWWEITNGAITDAVETGRVLTCRNVTERLATEVDAATRVGYLRYAFEVAQAALDLDPVEFLAQLSTVSSQVATMLEADFVYVDQLDERRSQLTNLAGYVGNGAFQAVNVGETISFDRVPHWIDRLREPEPVVVDDARSCDDPWAVEKRAVLGGEGGVVAVAMSAAGELFGVLGVSMAKTPRQWTDSEVTFLRILAETIAHVLERARIDEALRTSEARFRLLSETAADVVILLDARGRISYASPSSIGLLGYTPDDLVGRRAMALIHPDDRAEIVRIARRLWESGSFTSELRMLRHDGTALWVASSASTVLDADSGYPVEYRTSVRDISDRKRLEAELEQQALHDPLTGLGNRILLRSRLEAATEQSSLSVLLIDLDGFKEINDTHGHAVGDEVLRIIAARLRALTRPSNTLARTGGDEFVLLCPETDIRGAVGIGERAIRSLSQPMTVGSIAASVSASVGVSYGSAGEAEPDWMLIEADHAMYVAKRAGRGLVHVAHEATERAARSLTG